MNLSRSVMKFATDSVKKPKKAVKLFRVNGELIFGFHSVRLALENPRRMFNQLFYCHSLLPTSDRIAEVVDLANARDIPTRALKRTEVCTLSNATNRNDIVVETRDVGVGIKTVQ